MPTDKEMLDWLGRQDDVEIARCSTVVHVGFWLDHDLRIWEQACGPDIRRALAAAMDKQRKDGEHGPD